MLESSYLMKWLLLHVLFSHFLCVILLFLFFSLRIIPTPWEVTLSRLLSIVSDFEREWQLKYKLA